MRKGWRGSSACDPRTDGRRRDKRTFRLPLPLWFVPSQPGAALANRLPPCESSTSTSANFVSSITTSLWSPARTSHLPALVFQLGKTLRTPTCTIWIYFHPFQAARRLFTLAAIPTILSDDRETPACHLCDLNASLQVGFMCGG